MQYTIDSHRVNKEFLIVFEPKQVTEFDNRRRFAIGGMSLHKYIGRRNANKAISRALNSNTDKVSFNYRKYGKIDFYTK